MKKLVLMFTFLFVVSSLGFALQTDRLIDFNIVGDAAEMKVDEEPADDPDIQEGEDRVSGIPRIGDFHTDEWLVTLNSSARIMPNTKLSYVTNTTSQKYGNVMGIRVHYPVEAWNSYATVAPPYAVSLYSVEASEEEGAPAASMFTGGKGVITNVQTIRRVTSYVYGRNFAIAYYINIADQNGEITSYPMGYTYFNGWKQLQWMNPNYMADAEQRVLKREPLYPQLFPSVRFDSMVFYRPKTTVGGDFVTYVKDIDVEFEPAFVGGDEDIDDEGTWGIIQTESERRARLNADRIEEMRALREIERLRREQAEGGDSAE